MSKTKGSIQANVAAGVVFRPAPQVVAIATAAVGRLQKLLTICDYQIDALHTKNNASKESPYRELLKLARMVLNLQKDLDKYSAIAYPATKEFLSEKVVERDSINGNPNSDLEIQNKEAIMTGNGKNASKKQKFSHSFFQKQHSKVQTVP
jgi:hypothetical protein